MATLFRLADFLETSMAYLSGESPEPCEDRNLSRHGVAEGLKDVQRLVGIALKAIDDPETTIMLDHWATMTPEERAMLNGIISSIRDHQKRHIEDNEAMHRE